MKDNPFAGRYGNKKFENELNELLKYLSSEEEVKEEDE